MTSLIYSSEITRSLSPTELRALIAKAKQKNQHLDISGFLVKNEKNYVQYLEGPDKSVERLMNKISKDDLHKNIIVKTLPFETTICKSWSMIQTHDTLMGTVSFSHLLVGVLYNWSKKNISDEDADRSLGQLIIKQLTYSKQAGVFYEQ